jgi:arginase
MPLHVVWMDAHADFNTPESSPSGNVHGMPLASLCGLGPKPWVHLCQHPIALQGVQVSLVGVRDMDAEEKYLLDAAGVAVFDMQQIQHQGIHAVMNQVLASIPKGAHVHLSFDMDVMDPILAPGVDTAVPSGFDLSMAQHALSLLASVVGPHGQVGLGSVDWVELNPQRDHDYKTARLAIHLLGCALSREAAHTKPLLQGVA